MVFPTTFWLEFGKVTDHQVRASARSGFNILTWMRLGSVKPHPFTIRIPVNVGIMELLPSVKLFRIDDNQKIGDFEYTSMCPSISWDSSDRAS